MCTDGEVRLVGGSTIREGRVEVCMDERWGTICSSNQQLVRTVCSQLGFLSEGMHKERIARVITKKICSSTWENLVPNINNFTLRLSLNSAFTKAVYMQIQV